MGNKVAPLALGMLLLSSVIDQGRGERSSDSQKYKPITGRELESEIRKTFSMSALNQRRNSGCRGSLPIILKAGFWPGGGFGAFWELVGFSAMAAQGALCQRGNQMILNKND